MKPLKGYRNVTNEIMHPKCSALMCPRDSVICMDGVWLCKQCAIIYARAKKLEEKYGNSD